MKNLTLPWFLPLGLLVCVLGGRATLQLWREKKKPGEVLFMLSLSMVPLAIWLFIQFFPQE